MLDFDNTSNFGGHVAVGGHVGFIPIPQLEVGYGIQRSKVGPRDRAVENILQSVDFNFVSDSPLLKGLITARAQWDGPTSAISFTIQMEAKASGHSNSTTTG